MGLLEDAIREHLELKRRRGADPAEVERAEREALGPVRRTPEPLGDPGEAAERAASEEMLPSELGEDVRAAGAYDHAASEDFAADEVGDYERQLQAEPGPPPDHALEPFEESSASASQFDSETAEFRVEDEPSGPDDGGDVLEETPEFLQDAPEHDRLWFEQRPPRDFDFDD